MRRKLTLTDSRPIVLVTHGTHLLWAKQALVSDVVAFSRSLPRAHFVVSLGQPERAGQPVEQVSDRVLVHPFVPYGPHADKFDAMIP